MRANNLHEYYETESDFPQLQQQKKAKEDRSINN